MLSKHLVRSAEIVSEKIIDRQVESCILAVVMAILLINIWLNCVTYLYTYYVPSGVMR